MDKSREWRGDSAEKSYVPLVFAIIVVVIGTAIGGYYYFVQPKVEYAISASTFSRLNSEARALAVRLNEESCNRTLGRKLAAALNAASEYAATISFVQATEKKCGLNEDLLTPLFVAQRESSDLDGAEETLSRVIELYPNSADTYFNRGDIRASQGDYAGSYVDLRSAIYVYSDPATIRYIVFYLFAKDAAKLGRPCEAAAILQDYMAFDSATRRVQATIGLMRDWQKQGACPPPPGNSTTRVRYAMNRGAVILPVRVNGVEARMIIDTGASRTSITRKFAVRAGIAAIDGDSAIVHTANGDTWVMGGRAEDISLGGSHASNVPVFIQAKDDAGFGPGIDGLLGLSFLGNFGFTLDNGTLELRPLS